MPSNSTFLRKVNNICKKLIKIVPHFQTNISGQALPRYSAVRSKDGHAIADLSKQNYIEVSN